MVSPVVSSWIVSGLAQPPGVLLDVDEQRDFGLSAYRIVQEALTNAAGLVPVAVPGNGPTTPMSTTPLRPEAPRPNQCPSFPRPHDMRDGSPGPLKGL